jgi:hypothetical protein
MLLSDMSTTEVWQVPEITGFSGNQFQETGLARGGANKSNGIFTMAKSIDPNARADWIPKHSSKP